MKENYFQKNLIKEIKKIFPECIVMKTDANYIQGIPDLLILYGKHWAALECKRNKSASHQPNQNYWISKMAQMSFAKFIFPENRKEVLKSLEEHFRR